MSVAAFAPAAARRLSASSLRKPPKTSLSYPLPITPPYPPLPTPYLPTPVAQGMAGRSTGKLERIRPDYAPSTVRVVHRAAPPRFGQRGWERGAGAEEEERSGRRGRVLWFSLPLD